MSHYPMLIGGQWVSARSGRTEAVEDPATRQPVGMVAWGGEEDARDAIDQAVRAFPAWSRKTAYARAEILARAAARMVREQERLAALLTAEEGKPLIEARGEVVYAAEYLLWNAEEAKRVLGEVIPSTAPNQRLVVLKQPVGVVAAITPWNFPIAMVTRKIGPALAAGCTVILKPAEETPLVALETARILQEEGLPAGVLNVVVGDPEPIGRVLLNDPRVRKITFTGSTAVGKYLMREAAATVKRVSLELGGHAPFIVFDDCDLEMAVKGAALAKFLNAGQTCVSANRIFVQRAVVDAFSEKFTERASRLKVGPGTEPGVRIGPLINGDAVSKVSRHVADAVAGGAQLLTGGPSTPDQGYFFRPTVLSGVTDDMAILQEETFGPVAPIAVFDEEEEVVERANAGRYGLASYVYTENVRRSWRMLEALEYGLVGINDINPAVSPAPFGGFKESGIGREGGHYGLESFLEVKVGAFAL